MESEQKAQELRGSYVLVSRSCFFSAGLLLFCSSHSCLLQSLHSVFCSAHKLCLPMILACHTTKAAILLPFTFSFIVTIAASPFFLSLNFREKNFISPTCYFICFLAIPIDLWLLTMYALSALGPDHVNEWRWDPRSLIYTLDIRN